MKTKPLIYFNEDGDVVEHPYVECWLNSKGETVDIVMNIKKFKKSTEDWDYSI